MFSISTDFDVEINKTTDHSDLGVPTMVLNKAEEKNASNVVADAKQQQAIENIQNNIKALVNMDKLETSIKNLEGDINALTSAAGTGMNPTAAAFVPGAGAADVAVAITAFAEFKTCDDTLKVFKFWFPVFFTKVVIGKAGPLFNKNCAPVSSLSFHITAASIT